MQVDIDEAGHSMLNSVKAELERQIVPHHNSLPGLSMSVGDAQASRAISSSDHRRILRYGERHVRIQVHSHAPAEANVVTDISVEVPKDAVSADVFRMVCGDGMPVLELAMSDVLPQRGIVADIQLALFASEVISATLGELEAASRESIRKKGYTVPSQPTVLGS